MAKFSIFKAMATGFEVMGKVFAGDQTLDYIRENKPAAGEDLVIPAAMVPSFYSTVGPLLKLAEKVDSSGD